MLETTEHKAHVLSVRAPEAGNGWTVQCVPCGHFEEFNKPEAAWERLHELQRQRQVKP